MAVSLNEKKRKIIPSIVVSFCDQMGLTGAMLWRDFYTNKGDTISGSDGFVWWIYNTFGWTNVWRRNELKNIFAIVDRRRKNIVKQMWKWKATRKSYSVWCIFRVNATNEENMNEILNDSAAFGILMTILTVIQLISGTICVDCFNRSAIRQVTRMRVLLFKSLMRQDIGWYDIASSKSNLTIRLSEWVYKNVSSFGLCN